MASNASATPGGADANSAVRGFMAAAKLQSVQSLAMWWGDANGPTRNSIARDELEKRELIMLKCLKHDRYDIVGDAPSQSGARDIVLNVVYRDAANTTHLTVVPGPQNRWFVKDVDLQSLHSACIT
jgi:hypothetical protein